MCDYKNKFSSQVKRHEEQSHGSTSVACSIDGCEELMPYRKLKQHICEKHLKRVKLIDQKTENINQKFLIQLAAHKLFEENGTNPRNILVGFVNFL